MGFDVIPIQRAGLLVRNRLNIEDIPWSECKEFLDDQVFGGAGSQFAAGFELKRRSPGNGDTFKREGRQGDVNGDVLGRLKQENSVF